MVGTGIDGFQVGRAASPPIRGIVQIQNGRAGSPSYLSKSFIKSGAGKISDWTLPPASKIATSPPPSPRPIAGAKAYVAAGLRPAITTAVNLGSSGLAPTAATALRACAYRSLPTLKERGPNFTGHALAKSRTILLQSGRPISSK